MKPRVRLVVTVLSVFAVLFLGLVVAGYLFVRHLNSPERFSRQAEELLAANKFDEAMAQYQRAMSRIRDATERVAILRRMEKAVLDRGDLPLEEAVEAYRFLVSIRAGIVRLDLADDTTAETLLRDHMVLAQGVEARWSWAQVEEVAKMTRQLRGEDFEPANRALTIAGLRMAQYTPGGKPDYIAINAELERLLKASPDDGDLVYHLALSYVSEAGELKKGYLPTRAESLLLQAETLVRDYCEQHPEDRQAALRRIRVLLQKAWVADDQESMQRLRTEVDSLAKGAVEGKDLDLAPEIAQLLVMVSDMDQRMAARREGLERLQIDLIAAREQAVEVLRMAVDARAGDTEARLRLAGNLRALDRQEEAIQLYSQLVEDVTVPVDVGAIVRWNNQLYARFLVADLQLEKYAEAVDAEEKAELMKVVKDHLARITGALNEESPYVALLQGRIAFHEGDYRKAVRLLADAEQHLGRQSREAMLFSGLGLARLGETGAAVRQLAKYLSQPGSSARRRPDAWRELASCAVQLRDFDQAVKIGEKLLESDPDDEDTHLLLGRALLLQVITGRITERAEVFDKVVKLLQPLAAKGSSSAVRQLAELYLVTGEKDKAEKMLEEHCLAHSNDARALVMLYRGLKAEGRNEEARSWLEKARANVDSVELRRILGLAINDNPIWAPRLERILGITFNPDETARALGTVELFFEVGKKKDAMRLLNDAAAQWPEDYRVLTMRYERALRDGAFDLATTLIEEYAERGATEIDLSLWRAEYDVTRENYVSAISKLKDALRRDPNNSGGWILLGEAYRRTGDLYKAQESYEKALELKPNSIPALKAMVQVCDARRLHHQALRYLRQAVSYAPNDEVLLTTFLQYLDSHGSTDEALRIRLSLGGLRPKDHSNRRSIARLYMRNREMAQAKGVLTKLMQEDPGNLENVFAMAEFEAISESPEKGAELISSYIDGLGKRATADVWLRYAGFLQRVRLEEKLPDAFRAAIALEDPETMTASRYYADWLLQSGEAETAIQEFRSIYGKTRDDAIRQRIAACLHVLGKPDEALAELEDAYGSRMPTADAAFLQARVLTSLDRLREARLAVDRAIDLAPSRSTYYVLRATLLFRIPGDNNRELVHRDLDRALEIDDRSPAARLLLAQLQAREGNVGEAIDNLQILLTRNPDNAGYAEYLGNLLMRQGDFARLEQNLAEWEKRFQDQPMVGALRGRLHKARGQIDEAVAAFRQLYERHPQLGTLHEYAKALMEAGRPAAVVELLEKTTSVWDNDPRFLSLQARALAMNNNLGASLALFEKALKECAEQTAALPTVLEDARASLKPDELLPLLARTAADESSGLIAMMIGTLYLNKGELDKGIEKLEALAAEIGPDAALRGRLMLALGTAYHQANNGEKARESYEEALRLLPDDAVALNNLAYEMARQGAEPIRAVALAEKAVDLSKSDKRMHAYCLDTLGYAEMQANLMYRARRSLEHSIEMMPVPANWMHLGQVYLRERDIAEARRCLNQAKELAKEQADQDVLNETIRLLQDVDALEAKLKGEAGAPEDAGTTLRSAPDAMIRAA